MNVEKKAEKAFKELNDKIEKASKTADYEFSWRYEDMFINCQYETIKVDLGRTSQFKLLSIGEVNLVLRSLLKIYDLKQRALFEEVVVKDFTDITKQFRHIQAFLKEWRTYNDNDSFNWLSEGEVAEIYIDGMINWLIVCLHHLIYEEGKLWFRKKAELVDENNMKSENNDNVYTYTSVYAFCWAFYSRQEDIVNSAEPFKIMLFSEDGSTKYISINVDKHNNVDVTFHETPQEIELGDVVNIVRVMRTLMYKSYHTNEYGVDFNYVSSPDAMLSYIKDLIGHTPAKYVECFDRYEELEDARDKYLYILYEKAYLFLGKWLEFVAKWEEDQSSENLSQTQTDMANYYTDNNGQDMFAKFEALDDFREQRYALGFCYHNIEKYLIRAGRKTDDPSEDINKALNYLYEYRKLEKIYFE